MIRLRIIALVALLSFPLAAHGEVPTLSMLFGMQADVPPPIDLGVPDSLQETPFWCWAAVVQQIIAWRTGAKPSQCRLVAAANQARPEPCCLGQDATCIRPGSAAQMQFLIGAFGGRASAQAPPANAITLYRTLASGRPIIMLLRMGLLTSHAVVLRGMSFRPGPLGPKPMLHINDPLRYFANPVPLDSIAPAWIDSIVVH